MEFSAAVHHKGKNIKIMNKYIFIIATLMLTALTFRTVPERLITGKVTDATDGIPIPGVNIIEKGTKNGAVTDVNGEYQIQISSEKAVLVFGFIGYETQEVKVKDQQVIDVKMDADVQELSEIVVTGYETQRKRALVGNAAGVRTNAKMAPVTQDAVMYEADYETPPQFNTEEYATVHENIFLEATKNPLSTFSIDVDAASYSNIRRFINQGQIPPKDAVRIEEMVNYFDYDYTGPEGETPFAVHTEVSDCPWNQKHQLIHIGLQGKKIPTENLPPSNLVFLIDVSGSMSDGNKLPLLKAGFKMLTEQLRPADRVAIVVYAGAAGLVLPSTSGKDKAKILQALDKLEAGGSTAGGEGIRLAYEVAKENFQKEGNNRVILATDGDFNTGPSSNAEMERLIEEKREEGVFLTVLGFGMGNYKDSKMETLADQGNGNYAYIDNIQEAKKVLVSEFGGTLFTIAKDVKLQIEFNPAKVQAYRLIGYENRALKNEDFNNDKKDAGELGSGHTVTAMYEIIPAGADATQEPLHPIDPLKYQQQQIDPSAYNSEDLMTLKLRYKAPDGNKSKLISEPVTDQKISLKKASDNFRFAAAVAGFGMLLRDSEFKGDLTYDAVIQLAKGAKGEDTEGYRMEFIRMVESCNLMASK
jgi:Ca-activated chloride channel homolog